MYYFLCFHIWTIWVLTHESYIIYYTRQAATIIGEVCIHNSTPIPHHFSASSFTLTMCTKRNSRKWKHWKFKKPPPKKKKKKNCVKFMHPIPYSNLSLFHLILILFFWILLLISEGPKSSFNSSYSKHHDRSLSRSLSDIIMFNLLNPIIEFHLLEENLEMGFVCSSGIIILMHC